MSFGSGTTLFRGTLHGIVTSERVDNAFVMKLDEKIEGLPEEIVVVISITTGGYRFMSAYMRIGDKVIVDGVIKRQIRGKSQLEYIYMIANHLYNENLKVGY